MSNISQKLQILVDQYCNTLSDHEFYNDQTHIDFLEGNDL